MFDPLVLQFYDKIRCSSLCFLQYGLLYMSSHFYRLYVKASLSFTISPLCPMKPRSWFRS